MKKSLFILSLFIFISPALFAQTTMDPDWQARYWKTRTNFQNYFCVIGKEDGKSIPFNRDPIPIRDCENPQYYTPVTGSTYVGKIHTGDGNIKLGQYIAALALEYENLRLRNQNTDRTLKELYFAILAVERMDKWGEFYISNGSDTYDPGTNSTTLNGYLVRDDFRFNFWANYDNQKENRFRWENDWGDKKYGNDPTQHKRYIATDNNLACGNGSQSGTANVFNEDNHPSQDQLVGLMVGFAMVRKMNIDLNFSPGTGFPSINILGKSVEITRRILDHFMAVKTYYEDEVIKYSMNYFFLDPITNNFPKYGGSPAGSTYFINGYAIGMAGNYITNSSDYSQPFIIKIDIKNFEGNFVPWEEEIIRFDNSLPGSYNQNGLSDINLKNAFSAMDPDNPFWMIQTAEGFWGALGITLATEGVGIFITGTEWDGYWHGSNARSLEDAWDGLCIGRIYKNNQTDVNRRLYYLLAAICPETVNNSSFAHRI